MSVLITGGAGYIGSHIALELLRHGRAVVIADNLVTGRRSLVPSGASFEVLDIADEKAVRRLLNTHNVKSVIHCAGATIVPESVENPLKYYSNNTCASLALLRTLSC